jgi:hypothetical protein
MGRGKESVSKEFASGPEERDEESISGTAVDKEARERIRSSVV